MPPLQILLNRCKVALLVHACNSVQHAVIADFVVHETDCAVVDAM